MRPKQPERSGSDDLFRMRLENMLDLRHPLVRLAGEIDWAYLDESFAPLYAGDGRPGNSTRFMAGLHILKHTYGLSDEEVCDRWVENPYFQYFTGEDYFQHSLPHDRSSMTRWRNRVGEKALEKLVRESLRIAHKRGAVRTKDLKRVTVDTTVQPKAITFPTDAKLLYRAMIRLVKLAKKYAITLRQSYVRVGKKALIMAGRYGHAKQFKRHRRQIKFLRTRLGRLIRDIGRRIEGDEALEAAFARELSLASRVRHQKRRQEAPKVYSLPAPEVECIAKGKAHKPYEFGCKASVTTTNAKAPGGQFVLHIAALHGRPYDGHTLNQALKGTKAWTGIEPERAYVDKGYQGHDYPKKFRVLRSGQNRGVTPQIKRELKRRAAVEPVIGHMKEDGLLGRNYLKGHDGDKINAVLAGAGHNFRLLLNWFGALLRLILAGLLTARHPAST